MQRLSNNRFPKFTDEECITAFLWGKLEGRLTRRDVYTFIRDYWYDWFPKLPSYQAFCRRLNNLAPAFQALAEVWSRKHCAQFEDSVQYIIDSCPIILAKQARAGSAKVARSSAIKVIIPPEKSIITAQNSMQLSSADRESCLSQKRLCCLMPLYLT